MLDPVTPTCNGQPQLPGAPDCSAIHDALQGVSGVLAGLNASSVVVAFLTGAALVAGVMFALWIVRRVAGFFPAVRLGEFGAGKLLEQHERDSRRCDMSNLDSRKGRSLVEDEDREDDDEDADEDDGTGAAKRGAQAGLT